MQQEPTPTEYPHPRKLLNLNGLKGSQDYLLRIGLKRSYFKDLYHFLLVARGSHLVGIIGSVYLGGNVLFALLYLLGGDVIVGAEPGSLGDAFFFSVQTLSTIGYGVMSPKGFYGSALVTIEAFIGLLGVSMASGLMFLKFARPTSRVLFSNQMLLANREGKPCLMFRMANERNNDVVEAFLRVTVTKDEVTSEPTGCGGFTVSPWSAPTSRSSSRTGRGCTGSTRRARSTAKRRSRCSAAT